MICKMNHFASKASYTLFIWFFVILSFVFFTGRAKAANFCVSTPGELQAALTTAASNGEDDVIQIVQGTYVGNFVYTSNEGYSLTIEGGYTAGCGSRVVEPTNTILDGNNAGPVLAIASDQPIDIIVDGLTLENGRVIASNGGGLNVGNGKNVTLTNNTISDNSIDDYEGSGGSGGGVYVVSSDTVTLNNNIISNNGLDYGVGGGVSLSNADNANLINNTISNNNASYGGSSGGGVWLSDVVTATITNNTISNNSAKRGGGARLYDVDTVSLINNTISNNKSTNTSGGGIYLSDVGNATLTNNAISNNDCSDGSGGGVYVVSSDTVTLENNTISNNGVNDDDGGDGGVCLSNVGTATLTNNTIVNNSAFNGGGIFLSNVDTATFINNTISNNSGWGPGNGGGMYLSNVDTATLTNNTISDNNSIDGNGGGIFCTNSFLIITNCIIWGNNPDGIYASPGDVSIAYSDIQGGYFGYRNIDADPLFFNPEDNDYHLTQGSPCIDTGTSAGAPDTDFEGNPRPHGAGYDMGADEYTGPLNRPPVIDSFTAAPTLGTAPLPVTFTCIAHDPEGQIEQYTIDYGNGSNPETNTTGMFSHTYTAAGNYEAICTVFDNEGAPSVSAPVIIVVGSLLRVPAVYPTIQSAIDAAVDGDTVLVSDGIYTGEGNKNLDFHRKTITVQSENGPDNCIIDCEGDGRGFHFHSGEGTQAKVSGCTITNGNDTYGGGIYCNSSSPTITNCVIHGNRASYGAGIYCYGSSPTITNAIIYGNTATYFGGGICCNTSSPMITNCTIYGNESEEGGGVYYHDSFGTVTNSIIWGNTPQGLYLYSGNPVVTYSDIQGGYSGTGNINANPLFADAANADYHLQANSPCIDAGTNTVAPDTDFEGDPRPQGLDNDMGADEYLFPIIYIEPCYGNTPCYPTIQGGIDAAGIRSIIRIPHETYYEDIYMNENKTLYLHGGWNDTFTTVQGSVTISRGTALIKGCIVITP